MATDPRITVIEQYAKAMQDEADATRKLHEASAARVEAEGVIGDHILDGECWVYGNVAIIRDLVTRHIRRLTVVHLD